ncbi:hypothetical protein CC1G_07337 [Coprinopsis cinerea okayama7|uniref:Uncharacterized protein n=1 Tax=Coprinopsis cinerea (strain Okayama-7 / 130 / ATCC MYA-4618 / FGSC 9003) TaxID=240176 RepID=A8NNT0_COPC7|nr:hypothetical protein CC1G_07337 [Coprinopsis cinerea okayama7\|eukprot:XP_001835195.2 hypothetical protein CC1G_07337 [Coprinopsis cinerea okayama7\
MSLQSGNYYIKSYKDLVPLRSLLPKRIANANHWVDSDTRWRVEVSGNGVYQISESGPTSSLLNNAGFGSLLQEISRAMMSGGGAMNGWVVTPASSGEGYLVKHESYQNMGWVLSSESEGQVEVKQLSGDELPEERWKFEAVA